jgi:hypothetical protein
MRHAIVSALLVLAFGTAAQTTKITAAGAKDHVGETRTVCGKSLALTTRLAAKDSLHF